MSKLNELWDYLDVAAELEHSLMCQYLFAAYSLKRRPDEGLTPSQLERVRRWGSKVTFIARQEMAHLGLVMNLRAAVGLPPRFGRRPFPIDEAGWGVLARQDLMPFTPDAVLRFKRFEAPHGAPMPSASAAHDALAELEPAGAPVGAVGHVARPEPSHVLLQRAQQAVRSRSAASAPGFSVRGEHTNTDFEFGSIMELYVRIYNILEEQAPDIFQAPGQHGRQIPSCDEVFRDMNSLNQYGLDLVRVTDLESAKQAIATILFQGEGAPLPGVDYGADEGHTHYLYFRGIHQQLTGDFAGVSVCRNVVCNPSALRPRPSTTYIQHEHTRRIAALFNGCYQLMLAMLHSLYGNPKLDTLRLTSLTNSAFFPLMTMFIRPLAESLTELPAFEFGPERAGAPFELPQQFGALEPPEEDAALKEWFCERLNSLRGKFEELSLDEYRQSSTRVAARLEQMQVYMRRLADNWGQDWTNIGRTRLEATS